MRIILAPRPDDELIGCWSLLNKREISKVIYFFDCTPERRKEVLSCANFFEFQPLFAKDLSSEGLAYHIKGARLFLPSLSDSHPEHKEVNRTFRTHPSKNYYHVNLDRVERKKVLQPEEALQKLEALNTFYPSQAALWATDQSYYLFEAITQDDCKTLYKTEAVFYITERRAKESTKSGHTHTVKEVSISTDIQVPRAVIENIPVEGVASLGPTIIDFLVHLGASKVTVATNEREWVL